MLLRRQRDSTLDELFLANLAAVKILSYWKLKLLIYNFKLIARRDHPILDAQSYKSFFLVRFAPFC